MVQYLINDQVTCRHPQYKKNGMSTSSHLTLKLLLYEEQAVQQ